MFTFEPGEGAQGWGGILSWPDRRRSELWIRPLPPPVTASPTTSDGLVAAVLPMVMRRGGVLRVRGAVTRGALRNLTELAEAWADWGPGRFHRVTLEVDRILDGSPAVPDGGPAGAPAGAIVAWSRSLRSTHTLVRHLDALAPGHFDVLAVVRILGLSRRDTSGEDSALDGARRALHAAGVSLVTVETNAASAGLVDPEIGALPVVAAVLHALGPAVGCAVGLHGRSWPFVAQLRYPRPGPVLQDLLSGDHFSFRADGGATAPPQMAAAILRHPALAAAVSGCRRRSRQTSPCGRCPACALTALAFVAAGAAPPRPELRLGLARLATLPFSDPVVAADAEATLALWPDGGLLRRTLSGRAAVARGATVARDHLRWLASAAGLRAPWPR